VSTRGAAYDGRRHPVRIVVVDVERCPAEISAANPKGEQYVGLWVLARSGGEPRRLITLPFTRERITADELAQYFRGPEFADRPAGAIPPPHAPLISVVVPTTFSREAELRDCLNALAALEYPNFEVLLVDNRPEAADPPAWIADYSRVQVLRERRAGGAAARNAGLAAAAGEIVAFTDDDVIVDPGWLAAFWRRFEAHPEEAGIGGFMLPKELETEAQVAFEDYYDAQLPRMLETMSHRLERPPARSIFRKATIVEENDAGETIATFSLYAAGRLGPGQSRAFRTTALRAIGGFDYRLGTGFGEDILLWARLLWHGYTIGYEPAALVYHTHRRSLDELRRQIGNYGAGFTATKLALVLEDPRHLGALAVIAPRAALVLSRTFWDRLRSSAKGSQRTVVEDIHTSELARAELRGMLRGPAMYVHSAWTARRWRP